MRRETTSEADPHCQQKKSYIMLGPYGPEMRVCNAGSVPAPQQDFAHSLMVLSFA